jgi:hypothetical protein
LAQRNHQCVVAVDSARLRRVMGVDESSILPHRD